MVFPALNWTILLIRNLWNILRGKQSISVDPRVKKAVKINWFVFEPFQLCALDSRLLGQRYCDSTYCPMVKPIDNLKLCSPRWRVMLVMSYWKIVWWIVLVNEILLASILYSRIRAIYKSLQKNLCWTSTITGHRIRALNSIYALTRGSPTLRIKWNRKTGHRSSGRHK